MDFDIPVGKTGDCFARYLVRIEEMYQSARIMEQCVKALRTVGGPGARRRSQDLAAAPGRDEGLDGGPDPSLQALHRGLQGAGGETYTAVEAPKGEFGVYLVSDGTNKPYRCKIRAPGSRTCRRST